MHVSSLPVSSLLVITGLILAGSYGVASSGKSPPPGVPYVPRECPLDSLALDSLSPKEIVNLGLAPTPPIGIRQAVRDADSIADIPEFHDCQRFIELSAAGALKYGELYAIYRSNDLETLRGRLKPAAAMTSMVGAVIYSVEGYYAPLGLAPGFNCLYLFHTSTGGPLSAKVVQYGRHRNDCADTVAAGTPTGLPEKTLTVKLQNPLNAIQGDFAPAVARWEWDSTNQKQYIGIKWGSEWATVGDASLVPAPVIATPVGTAKQKATAALKGWFDEQLLAVGDPSVLSTVRGAVFPNQELGAYQVADFVGGWKPVAYVSLTSPTPADIAVYTARMNLTRAAYGYPAQVPMNRIFLCKGIGQPVRMAGRTSPPAPSGLQTCRN